MVDGLEQFQAVSNAYAVKYVLLLRTMIMNA